ncbi:MAG TPA: hypothetical protein PLI12_01415, partial [Acetobacteraceae bacterium]|nr:hypothetical protein [Acetobacteraceae bacterium]
WRIGNLTIAGVLMGLGLLAFCTGVVAVGMFGLGLGLGPIRTLAFLALVFGSQTSIYAIRERRHFWHSRPSLWVAASSLAAIAIAGIMAITGFAMIAVSPFLVLATLLSATLFALLLDTIKIPIFSWLSIV